EVLRLAASVEQPSSHQLGRALAAYGARRFGTLAIPTAFEEVIARGVRGEVEGRRVQVGSSALFDPAHHATFDRLARAGSPQTGGRMVVGVTIDGEPTGVVAFADRLRPGVAEMIRTLRALGVERIVMLTGDSRSTAEQIARQAGIGEVRSQLLPAEKVAAVAEIERAGMPVIMVGDGVNDAPALATATVGVAMGARGTGISAEAADVVLLDDEVTDLVGGIRIGKRMRQIALQCIGIGLGLSGAFMVVAAFGLISPPIGALLQEAIDVAVILNALRARSG